MVRSISNDNFTWDEGGVYMDWSAIESMRYLILDHIVSLTSSYVNRADIDAEYVDAKLANARLLLQKLGG
jgi:hypothetical protein